jgi:hypothetical protein
MPFPSSRSLTLALPAEQYAHLERLAKASGRPLAAVARELCLQGLAPSAGGRRVTVELEPAEASAAERLAGRYGLSINQMFRYVAMRASEVPDFIAGHLLNRSGRSGSSGPAARG